MQQCVARHQGWLAAPGSEGLKLLRSTSSWSLDAAGCLLLLAPFHPQARRAALAVPNCPQSWASLLGLHAALHAVTSAPQIIYLHDATWRSQCHACKVRVLCQERQAWYTEITPLLCFKSATGLFQTCAVEFIVILILVLDKQRPLAWCHCLWIYHPAGSLASPTFCPYSFPLWLSGCFWMLHRMGILTACMHWSFLIQKQWLSLGLWCYNSSEQVFQMLRAVWLFP